MAPAADAAKEDAMATKLSPVLVVEDFQASLNFYREVLGFTAQSLMPEENPFFAILQSGGAEVMLEGREAMKDDFPAAAEKPLGFSGILYLEVEDIDAVRARLGNTEVVVKERIAPYGMNETMLRDPAGYLVVIAQPVANREAAMETAAAG
jgi:uncharacterized glyoxalase superfamily protein PhnB